MPTTYRETIMSCIMDHLNDCDPHELDSTKLWLEGWICGVTDPYVHPEHASLNGAALAMLNKEYKKRKALRLH